jgi:hypothetical protein
MVKTPMLGTALAAAKRAKQRARVEADRLFRDDAFIAGLMIQRVPFIVSNSGSARPPASVA